MGLHVNSLTFLLLAHARGISFNRVLMIGRQSFGLTRRDLHRLTELPLSPALKNGLSRLTLEPHVYAEEFFQLCGATKVDALDNSAYEGATLIHDLNVPVPDALRGQYDLVVDGGSIEHVFNIPVAFQNCMNVLRVGGHYVCNTATNNYSGHGFINSAPSCFMPSSRPRTGSASLTRICTRKTEGG